MKRLASILISSLFLSGCNDPSQGPGPVPDFRISPARQWSGGEVEISSQYFATITSTPSVRLDSSTLVGRRINDSTFAVQLPSVPSGDYAVLVDSPDGPYQAGTVQVFGYRDNQALAVVLYDYLTTTTLLQGQVVLGSIGAAGGGRVATLDPETGTVTTFWGLSAIGQTVGPSFRGPDAALVIDTSGVVGEWQLSSQPVLLDTVSPGLRIGVRALAALGPRSYLGIDGKWGSTSAGIFQIESVARIYLSPSGNRATVSASVSLPGIPVFDMQTGDTAYTLPLPISTAATFTRFGTRLYVVGGYAQSVYLNQLFALDATTGAILAHDSLPALTRRVGALALDASETLLFAATESDGVPQVLVYDASTLEHLGTLSAPGTPLGNCFGFCEAGTLAVDESRRTIYYVVSKGNTVILRFDLMR